MSNFLHLIGKTFKPFKKQSQQKFTVSYESEFVKLSFGSQEIVMHYRDAFKIASMIHHNCKQCKRDCGDTSRGYTVLGDLRDAEENDKRVRAHF